MGNGFVTPSLGIDFGTANTLGYFEGRGFFPLASTKEQLSDDALAQALDGSLRLVDLFPPKRSVALRRVDTGEILCVGDDAYNMTGRVPPHLKVDRSVKDGRVCDTDILTRLFDELFFQACPEAKEAVRITQPKLIVIPVSGNTQRMHQQIMRRAMQERFLDTSHDPHGVDFEEDYKGRVVAVSQAGVSLLGAGREFSTGKARLVIDIGGGTTNVAVVCYNEVVFHRSFPLGGDLMDQTIVEHVRKVHQLEIGLLDAERIKKVLGVALDPGQTQKIKVPPKSGRISGRCLKNGLPRTVTLTNVEIYQCLKPVYDAIAEKVTLALDQVSLPQIHSDLLDSISPLTGGGSLVDHFDLFLKDRLQLKIQRVPNPLFSVILGVKVLIDNPVLLDKFDLSRMDNNRFEEAPCATTSKTTATTNQTTPPGLQSTSGTSVLPH